MAKKKFAYYIQEIAKIVPIKIYTNTSYLDHYYAQFCNSDLVRDNFRLPGICTAQSITKRKILFPALEQRDI